MLRWLWRLIFPPKCIFCDKIVENDRFAVCENCLPNIAYNRGNRCKVCGMPLDVVYGDMLCANCRRMRHSFQKAYIPLVYKDKVRESILGFKFRGRRARAVTLAAFMLMAIREAAAPWPDCITYVPLHPFRLGTRGYNQSQLLAEALGGMMHVPVISALRKTKHTKPLSKQKRIDRKKAVKDVFALRKNADIQGKRVLLVDDIFTTGSTIETCSRLIKKGGAREIYVTTAAVTPPFRANNAVQMEERICNH